MELRDYIENIEPYLSENEGRSVIRCVVEFSKLIAAVMPESGKKGIEVAEKFLNKEANSKDLEKIRIEIWNDIDKNYKNTAQEEALRAIICALFFPIGKNEHFDTLTYAIDFSKNANPKLNDNDFKEIIENEFKA